MIKTFLATYITPSGKEESQFFEVDVPSNQLINAVSYAGREFIKDAVYNNPNFMQLKRGKNAIVEVTD